ncbi:TPR-like protein [Ceraceosorus guamensis]|uniref:TPR-like protein n=1 Tax=Ceraceosorus guamensis TaxID=1522189 RepID=A0A316VMK0_9BASI|nr:TPR-like protein [Ceraceosorus guamensis]PWN38777.1 TPR-like protein [Ceraceosorus guamensis]
MSERGEGRARGRGRGRGRGRARGGHGTAASPPAASSTTQADLTPTTSQRVRKQAALPLGSVSWESVSLQRSANRDGARARASADDAEEEMDVDEGQGGGGEGEREGEEEEDEYGWLNDSGESLRSDSADEYRESPEPHRKGRPSTSQAPTGAASRTDPPSDVYAGFPDLEQLNLTGMPPIGTTRRKKRDARKRVQPSKHLMERPADWAKASQKKRELDRLQTEQEPDQEGEVDAEDFGRLINGIASDAVDPASRGPAWRAALGAVERNEDLQDGEEFNAFTIEDDLRAAAGFRRLRAPGQVARTRRRGLGEENFSDEVKHLLMKANEAYIDARFPEAIEALSNVIRIEPTVRSAWGTLALIHLDDLRNIEQGLQCRVIEAHLTKYSLESWREIAEASEKAHLHDQAEYCLGQAVRNSRVKDKSDVMDLMWQRANKLSDMSGVLDNNTADADCDVMRCKQAVQAFFQILHHRPHNPDIIQAVVPLLCALNRYDRAAKLLVEAREYNLAVFPDPTEEPDAAQGEAYQLRPTFGSNEIVSLADIYLRLGRPVDALDTIRGGARWLQGRAEEEWWDDFDSDDREFDLKREEGGPKGIARPDPTRRVMAAPVHQLDPAMRVRLGLIRAALKDTEEAMFHFSIWKAEVSMKDKLQWEMFRQVGRALVQNELWAESEEWVEAMLLSQIEELCTYDVAQLYAQSLQHNGRLEDAISQYIQLIEQCPDDLQVRIWLAQTYEANHERDKAIEALRELVRLRQELPSTDMDDASALAASATFFREHKSRGRGTVHPHSAHSRRVTASKEERARLYEARQYEIRISWADMEKKEDQVFVEGWWSHDMPFESSQKLPLLLGETAEEREAHLVACSEWLDLARGLTDGFCAVRKLFIRDKGFKSEQQSDRRRDLRSNLDRQANSLISRIRDSLVEDGHPVDPDAMEFCGVHFDDWLLLFMKYAFVLTKMGNVQEAYEILSHIATVNVFWNSQDYSLVINLTHVACALYARDAYTMLETARQLAVTWQFHAEPLRIVTTLANTLGFYAIDSYTAPHAQKSLLRRNRIHEAMVAREPHHFRNDRWVVLSSLSRPSGRRGAEWDRQSDDEAEEEEAESAEANDALKSAEEALLAADQAFEEKSRAFRARYRRPTQFNAPGEITYGSLMLGTLSWQASLAYWLRVFAKHQHDPLVSLGAAAACLQRAMQRQVDNRQHFVLQAITLLASYRKLRHPKSVEVEFNFGRAMHHIGLNHKAEVHYRRALELHDEWEARAREGGSATPDDPDPRERGFDCYREAAHNLSMLYTLSGNPHLAREIYERYLTLH